MSDDIRIESGRDAVFAKDQGTAIININKPVYVDINYFVQHFEGISFDEFIKLTEESGIHKSALNNFFSILELGKIPSENVDQTLRQLAADYKKMEKSAILDRWKTLFTIVLSIVSYEVVGESLLAPLRKLTGSAGRKPKQRAKYRLRSKSGRLADNDIRYMIKKHNFFCKKYDWNKKWTNESGKFKNEFEDNGDGTVTDHATGLMWQQSGSVNYMNFEDTPAYVEKINRERLGGYDDWRLPTIEELASLLESKKNETGLYIDPVFDEEQWWCWSSDKRAGGGVWSVYFNSGNVDRYNENFGSYVRLVRRGQ